MKSEDNNRNALNAGNIIDFKAQAKRQMDQMRDMMTAQNQNQTNIMNAMQQMEANINNNVQTMIQQHNQDVMQNYASLSTKINNMRDSVVIPMEDKIDQIKRGIDLASYRTIVKKSQGQQYAHDLGYKFLEEKVRDDLGVGDIFVSNSTDKTPKRKQEIKDVMNKLQGGGAAAGSTPQALPAPDPSPIAPRIDSSL
eukprot:754923-Hanusia_phi.AAC.1